MKKDELTELGKINETKKMPLEVRKDIMKKMYKNVLLAIFIISYLLLLLIGNNTTEKAIRVVGFNIFSMILLLISITIFEIAYKKDNDALALNGIEVLLVAIITLFMPYMYFESKGIIKTLYMLTPIYVGAYYVLKTIIIALRENKKYKASISEIKELIQKEEKKEIDLEEKKKNREQKKKVIEEKELKEEIFDEIIIQEEKKENSGNPKKIKPKTKSNSKPITKKNTKTNKNITKKAVVAETTEKPKRGRPKKIKE